MPAKPSRYITLAELTLGWAVTSGEPLPVVRRRLADNLSRPHAISLHPISFRGDSYSLLDLSLMLMGRMHAGNGTDILDGTLLPVDEVFQFCRDLRIMPPGFLLSGLARFYWSVRKFADYDCPPEFAQGADLREAQAEREHASFYLDRMERRLLQVTGQPARKIYVAPDGPLARSDTVAWEHQIAKWQKEQAAVERALQKIDAPELNEKLARILSAWQAIIPTASAPKARANSLAEEDAPLIEEMRRGILAGEYTSASDGGLALAKRAKGTGTELSKAKRLADQYKDKFEPETRTKSLKVSVKNH